MEEKLRDALEDKIKYLAEKSEMAESTRSYFGEDMYKKLIDIDQTRSETLLLDDGSL